MEKLTRSQFLTVVIVAAFLAAAFGATLAERYARRSELTVGLPDKSATSTVVSVREINERILRQEELVVRAVEMSSNAVVSIIASKDVPVIEQIEVSPFGNDPFFRQFFGDDFKIPQYRQNGTEKRNVSSGSGFIASRDGYIITNKHVVADAAADYTVLMNDGSKIKGRVVARDPVEDLAIVKVDKSGLTAVTLGDSSGLKIGQSAIAIGNSLGEFRNTVSVGVISGLQRSITAGGEGVASEQLSELIQTDAAINFGNSGGPLLNIRGEVIGINTAIVQGAENIGFSIPINKAKRDLESVRKTGKITYPYLGVRYVMVTEDLQKKNSLPVSAGAWLRGSKGEAAVVAGSPAAKAGLKEGDIIIEINGEKVTLEKTLAMLLQKFSVGDAVAVTYLRAGERHTVSITLAERP